MTIMLLRAMAFLRAEPRGWYLLLARSYRYFSEQRWISMLVGNLRHSLASR